MDKIYINLLCTTIIVLFIFNNSFAQLVTKRDYKAAIALQAGASTGVLSYKNSPQFNVSPDFGLKMTFPFNRKYFLGTEINYNGLKTANTYKINDNNNKIEADFDLRRIQIPVYLKYMLNCNRASILFGAYASWTFNSEYSISGTLPETDSEIAAPNKWEGGLVIGYEHQLAKRLNLMLKVNGGVLSMTDSKHFFNQKSYPLQASLTLSYDILRIGDCGCN